MKQLQPVHVDGILYVLIGVFGVVQTSLSSDESYKYVSPLTLWYLKLISAAILAGASSLKMFRSTSYGQSRNGSVNDTSKSASEVHDDKPKKDETITPTIPSSIKP
jgi:hypothetical protein